LPFKIELNKWGKILMSPASNKHGNIQFEVGRDIDRKKSSGTTIMECSINTPEGVKVADVAWASDKFMERYGFDTPYPQAPEICVEVVSPSHSKAEIEEKVQLYLNQGAHEVWVVYDNGITHYYNQTGEILQSQEVS
jgi:Uma2 family endonuclease